MQLCLALPVTNLCYRFNISKTTASRIFLETLHCKTQIPNTLAKNHDRENDTSMCLQAKFRTKITVIIDCFEIFIEQPLNLTACHLIWSSYKQHNAIKYLIDITPQGTISFISEGWSGWTSDQNSNFLSKLTHGDTVMPDRGFNVGEMLGSVDARLKMHAFTKGKNHLHALEVGENQTIANVKIHAE